jgi:hypothetical protein
LQQADLGHGSAHRQATPVWALSTLWREPASVQDRARLAGTLVCSSSGRGNVVLCPSIISCRCYRHLVDRFGCWRIYVCPVFASREGAWRLTSSSSRQIRAAREFAAELRRYMRQNLMFVHPIPALGARSLSRLSAALSRNEHLGMKEGAYNKVFQPTLPLRGSSLGPTALGAAEHRRWPSQTRGQ